MLELFCALAIFVPIDRHLYQNDTVDLDIVGKAELERLVNTTRSVVAIGLRRKAFRAREIEEGFREYAKKYSEDALFVNLNNTDAKGLAE